MVAETVGQRIGRLPQCCRFCGVLWGDKDQPVVSVWSYQALLMELFEGVGLYLQFVTKFGENIYFLKLQSQY